MNRLLALALTCLTTAAFAIPSQIALTARISDSGSPLTGAHTVTVRLHSALTGGLPTWTETHQVTITDGVLFVTLGTQSPLDATNIDGTALFVEVQVDSTVLSPRLALVSVPYAVRAQVADNAARLGGSLPSDYALVSHVHTGLYLPLGPVLQCAGTDKMVGLSSNGSVVCAADREGTPWSVGVGLSLAGSTLSASFAGSGVATTAARSDHSHAGIYLPIGTFLVCPAGQSVEALTNTGQVVCRNHVNVVFSDQSIVNSTTNGQVLLSVNFAGSGVALTAARSDHTHGINPCPASYSLVGTSLVANALCVKRVVQANVTWADAASSCYSAHNQGELCTYSQLRIAVAQGGAVLAAGHWMADRVDDNFALRTNSTNVLDFDEKVDTSTQLGSGFYCCRRN